MHDAAYAALGLDVRYVLLPARDARFAVEAIRTRPDIRGFSVTHPFKISILPLLDEIDPVARAIGAVNTVHRRGDRLYGFNTDWIGALACLRALGPVAGQRFVIIGAGGAARAIAYGIGSEGGEVLVVNRGDARGRSLARDFDVRFVPLSQLGSVAGDCLVHATPVGMAPDAERSLVPSDLLPSYGAVVDVIYNPARSRLLRDAGRAGVRAENGVEMVVAQGAEQVRIWTGREAPTERMRAAVLAGLD